MIAFEPPCNDRNRVRELIGLDNFNKYERKFVCFQRQFFKPIATTDNNVSNKIYATAMSQWTIYPNLFLNNAKLAKKFENILLPINADDAKCFQDVDQLTNLVKIWETVLISGIKNQFFITTNIFRPLSLFQLNSYIKNQHILIPTTRFFKNSSVKPKLSKSSKI